MVHFLSYSTEVVRDLSLIQHINKIPRGSRSHHNKKSTKVRHPNRFKRWWAIGLLMTTPPSCFRISSRDLRQFTTTIGSWSRSKLYNSFTRAPSMKENKHLRFRRKASGSQGQSQSNGSKQTKLQFSATEIAKAHNQVKACSKQLRQRISPGPQRKDFSNLRKYQALHPP